MTDILKVANKEYKVKHGMTVKQVREGRKKVRSLIDAVEQAKEVRNDPNTLDNLTKQVLQKTDEQDDIIADTLKECVEVEIDNMQYMEALFLYNELFRHSVEIPKNSGMPATSE